ncbi:hypothetical protein [Chitinophaga nivalis]|uniref:Uncharacterized protein n=1 Tax=Chitinophaga nivalis TaxID=2991709 RepID=A0ABT3IJ34_9BACT|nr:hypothetical protein [Chitinophaga nivalis]MCW3466373.1 hypothetical protein [Chitinophaga nivalis]MCW3483936.1 hypothetical protein [Chitinophaga nivalis]
MNSTPLTAAMAAVSGISYTKAHNATLVIPEMVIKLPGIGWLDKVDD